MFKGKIITATNTGRANTTQSFTIAGAQIGYTHKRIFNHRGAPCFYVLQTAPVALPIPRPLVLGPNMGAPMQGYCWGRNNYYCWQV